MDLKERLLLKFLPRERAEANAKVLGALFDMSAKAPSQAAFAALDRLAQTFHNPVIQSMPAVAIDLVVAGMLLQAGFAEGKDSAFVKKLVTWLDEDDASGRDKVMQFSELARKRGRSPKPERTPPNAS